VLLERQIAVDSYEHIELGLSQTQQLAVGTSRPSLPDDGMNFDRIDMFGKPTIHTLVEKNLQAASWTANVAARSRNATTCSRVTKGRSATRAASALFLEQPHVRSRR
jgi:hypothetical protein